MVVSKIEVFLLLVRANNKAATDPSKIICLQEHKQFTTITIFHFGDKNKDISESPIANHLQKA